MSAITMETRTASIGTVVTLDVQDSSKMERFNQVVAKFKEDVSRVESHKEALEKQLKDSNSLKRVFFKKSKSSSESIDQLRRLIQLRTEQLTHFKDWKAEALRWEETYQRVSSMPVADETLQEYLQSANQNFMRWRRIDRSYEQKITENTTSSVTSNNSKV